MDPVLVVGAGPVGLSAAAFLAHFGTPVRIIDSSAAPTPYSKALVLWRRSLLTLSPVISALHWSTLGCTVKSACFGDGGAFIGQLDLQDASEPTTLQRSTVTGSDLEQHHGKVHALPPGVLLSQADVESALVATLRDRYGVEVERCTSLTELQISPDSSQVQCTLLNTQTDDSEHATASYLIACDGGRSTVRKQLKLQFQGSTLDQRWLLGDFKFVVDENINPNKPHQPCEGRPLPATLFVGTSSVGVVGFIPIGRQENMVRIIWNADASGPSGQPSLADFQDLTVHHTRMQIRLVEPVWLSEFKINERQVDSYVHCGGRVLLAGDAAHVHSPAGGQGMNTGIQDAANLAWKVALAACGEAVAGHKLIDTYQEERHRVGAQVVKFSGRLLRANTVRTYWLRLLRSLVLRFVLGIPIIRANMVAGLTGDMVQYTNSSLAAPAAPSDAADSTVMASTGSAAASCGPSTSAAMRAVWGCCRAGMAFPDVSIMIDGVECSAAELLHCPVGCLGTLVLLPDAAKQLEQQLARSQEQVVVDGSPACGAKQPTAACATSASAGTAMSSWPSHWAHWKLNTTQVHQESSQAGVADAWGLLVAAVGGRSGVGVLVRPDGIVAAVGGPAELKAWLAKHVCSIDDSSK